MRWNVAGEYVQHSGFAGARSSRDENVQAAFDNRGEQFQHGLSEALVLEHLPGGNGIASETADGEASAVDGQRRNDGIHAGAVCEAGINHGRGFIDAAAYARDDAIDDLHQVPIIFEGKAGGFEFAGAFDIDPVKPVDQDIGDAGIFEKGF